MENETVKDLCDLVRTPRLDLFKTYEELADRIFAAHNREMADKDEKIAWLKRGIDQMDTNCNRLKERIALLEAALKPVMKLDMSKFGFLVDYGECFEAVREAKRIMKEGENNG